MRSEQLEKAKNVAKQLNNVREYLDDVRRFRKRLDNLIMDQNGNYQPCDLPVPICFIETLGNYSRRISVNMNKHKTIISGALRMIEADITAEIEALEHEFADL